MERFNTTTRGMLSGIRERLRRRDRTQKYACEDLPPALGTVQRRPEGPGRPLAGDRQKHWAEIRMPGEDA